MLSAEGRGMDAMLAAASGSRGGRGAGLFPPERQTHEAAEGAASEPAASPAPPPPCPAPGGLDGSCLGTEGQRLLLAVVERLGGVDALKSQQQQHSPPSPPHAVAGPAGTGAAAGGEEAGVGWGGHAAPSTLTLEPAAAAAASGSGALGGLTPAPLRVPGGGLSWQATRVTLPPNFSVAELNPEGVAVVQL
jgi:hypothetical protein